ncbi:MAG: aldo/keto reductase [Bacteroidota bacterium]|nr:aldo/keto reductase [Bacteroidota bacterium]
MKTLKVGNTDLEVSQIAYGCMTIGGSWDNSPLSEETIKKAIGSIREAMDQGISFFDHADIYTYGKSEEAFSFIWNESASLREKIILQTKCGIRFGGIPKAEDPQRYDFSYSHIMNSVDNSLKRLKTDYIDILLLHRPDPLVEPEEVAKAFDELHDSGKVRYFGVSNHNAMQIELLKGYVKQPLIVNQLELNILHSDLIESGIITNQRYPTDRHIRASGTLEYCRLNNITIQAWGSLANGLLTGRHTDNKDEKIERTYKLVSQFAEKKNVSPEAIVIAWILRHPAKIQPVIGTTNPERIRACCQADKVELSREEWYALFSEGRGAMMP